MTRAVPKCLHSTDLRARHVVRTLALACMLAIPVCPALAQATNPAAPAKLSAGQVTALPVPGKPPAAQPGDPLAWNTLNASQQAALRPLAPIWGQINPNRKRKWIALSANFSKLSAAEQTTLHGRMAEWATLSNAERNRARLNFAETRSLSSAEKKSQWEAYQALSPSQKQQLAREAAIRLPSGAAPAVSARTRGKLAAVPTTRSDTGAARTAGPIVQAPHPSPAASPAAPAQE